MSLKSSSVGLWLAFVLAGLVGAVCYMNVLLGRRRLVWSMKSYRGVKGKGLRSI